MVHRFYRLVSKLTNNIQQRIAHGKFNPNKNFSKLIIFKLVKGYLITDTILDGNFCPPLRRCEWRNRMLKYMKRKLWCRRKKVIRKEQMFLDETFSRKFHGKFNEYS